MTQFTRWLILLIGGTLVFGMLCFGSGLLLGMYLWDTDRHTAAAGVLSGALAQANSATVLPAIQAPAVPAAPAVAAPAVPAAPAATVTHTAPAISVQPSGVQITAPTATVQMTAPVAAENATPAASPEAAAAKTASAAAPGAAAPAPPGQGGPAAAPGGAAGAVAVRQVPDLVVGVPADEDPGSALRGPLVSAASAAAAPAPAAPAPPANAGSTAPPAEGGAAPTPAGGGAGAPVAASKEAAAGPSVPAAKPATRAFAVRVGSYLDPAAAQRRADTLQTHGYHPLILSSRHPDEGLTWYSVVLGQAGDLPAARRQATQFAADQGYQAEIVSWALAPAAP